MTQAIYFPGLIPSPFDELEPFLLRNESAAGHLRQASEVLGYDLIDACQAASQHRTSELTAHESMVHGAAQMVICLGLVDWLRLDPEFAPVCCGGQSLGGWIAAVFTGVLSWPDMLDMAETSARIEMKHFAALDEPVATHLYYLPTSGLLDELLARATELGYTDLELSLVFDGGVYGVAGPRSRLGWLGEQVTSRGGRLLYVSNRVEHCATARPVHDRLMRSDGDLRWHDPVIPVLSEADGMFATDAAGVRKALYDTMVTPVRWDLTVGALRAAGVETVHVVGTNNKNMFHRALAKDFIVVPVTPGVALASGADGARRR